MVKTLAELAILNMRTVDIMYPNNALANPPRNGYILSDVIFHHGGNLFMRELGKRDRFALRQWRLNNNHFCCVDEGPSSDKCWCSCNPQDRVCKCSCFHVFYMLINYIVWENGSINYNAPFKLVVAQATRS